MLAVVAVHILDVGASLEQCCQLANSSSRCHNTCQQVLMFNNGDYEAGHRNIVLTSCPQSLREFWRCINESSAATADVESSSCCELALKTSCQLTCRAMRGRDELNSACTRDDELVVSVCLDRREEERRCCALASSGTQCGAICRRIFAQDSSPTAAQLSTARSSCSRQVADCLLNYTQTTPGRRHTDSLSCCDEAETSRCRVGCKRALSDRSASDEDVINQLTSRCGLPHPSVAMWQCLLRGSTDSTGRYKYERSGGIQLTGVDGASLQCCHKAVTFRCRHLCITTYSRDWTRTMHQFQQHCVYRPQETHLNKCLHDVEAQCQLGCSRLEYCSNFNDRPTELFRSCTKRADESARSMVRLWQTGTISLPTLLSYDIPVKCTAAFDTSTYSTVQ